jgi:hypothetical protein
MTQRVILPNGQAGIIGSPAHKLLDRMASTVTGYAVRGRGASDTQLRSLAKAGHVHLHFSYEGARPIIEGAYLTPAGERYVEMLNRAAADAERIEQLATAARSYAV